MSNERPNVTVIYQEARSRAPGFTELLVEIFGFIGLVGGLLLCGWLALATGLF